MAEKKKMHSNCDECMHYTYDDYYDEYNCEVNMDEDDYQRINSNPFSLYSSYSYCPYYRPGDEYTIVRKQN